MVGDHTQRQHQSAQETSNHLRIANSVATATAAAHGWIERQATVNACMLYEWPVSARWVGGARLARRVLCLRSRGRSRLSDDVNDYMKR